MIKKDNLDLAVKEAKRFIAAAKECLIYTSSGYDGKKLGVETVSPGISAAAMKRASLDLTRALSKMRREHCW